MGKGGGGKTQSTSYSTNIPEYARPYVEQMLGQAQALTDINQNPYQPYGGERFAQFTPLQQQSFAGLGGLNGGQAMQQALNMATTAGNASWTDPGTSQRYMDPYMQNVVDIQKREARRDAGIAATQRGAQAVGAKAYGGTRQAIMDAEAQRNTGQLLSDIQGRGLQAAYGSGMGQFNTEQAGRMQAAGFLGGTGQGILGLQNQMGGQQQQQVQNILSQQMADYAAQQNYPYQQLAFMSDLLRGTGVGPQTSAIYQTAPTASPLNQLAGLGLGAYGMSKMGAAGGVVPAGLADLAVSQIY